MSLTHFAAPCQQLFFVFVNFFHRSGEVVFVSAVREATQSSTACQQLFFHFSIFSFTRRVVVVAKWETIRFRPRCQQLFSASEKFFFEPFVSPSSRRSLCACQTPPGVHVPFPPGARSVYGLFPTKGQEVFFQNVTKKEAAL